MKTVTQQRRLGFTGIEIIVVLIILVIIFAGLGSSPAPTIPDGKRPPATTQSSGTSPTPAVNDVAARTGMAMVRMTRDGADKSADDTPAVDPARAPDPAPQVDPAPTDVPPPVIDPADAAPAVSPADADPAVGDTIGEILRDILDGL